MKRPKPPGVIRQRIPALLAAAALIAILNALFFYVRQAPESPEQPQAERPAGSVRNGNGSAPGNAPDVAPVAAVADKAAVEVSSDADVWPGESLVPPDFTKIDAFDGWLKGWKEATPEARAAMADEGTNLAAARRPEFKNLIATDPRQALERSVPRVVRQDLPEEIVAQLEKPVSRTGDYDVYFGRPAPGTEVPLDGLVLRYFSVDGVDYKARVFGEMTDVTSRKGIPLRGVAIDRELAVAESPVRQLEDGERIPDGTVVKDTCPVSGKSTEAVSSGETVTASTPTVEIAEEFITLCDGSHVTVLDEKYRALVQAAGSGSSFFMDAHPGTGATSIGNLRCLYIRAAYPEHMTAPNTEDQAEADMRNNARFYQESSFGKLTATYTITPLIALPQTRAWYGAKDQEVNGLSVIHGDAREAARRLGYDSNQYHCVLLRVAGGLRGGSSWGGGSSVWLGWGGMDVINHEVGHSLGLGHANRWDTNDGTPYGNGYNVEYGNGYDVMGSGGGFAAHYRSTAKRSLGWLPAAYVHFPKTDGIFRIHAFDQPRLEEGKRYSLNVAKNSSISYDIEYHANNSGISKQAWVLYGGRLIDTTQNTPPGRGDAGIQVGRTYSDPESDQHFTLLSVNQTDPPSIDLAYKRGPFPGNVAPTATLAASTTSVAVGGSVTFTATANDANGDPLAYHWHFSDGLTGDNSAVFTRTFSSATHVSAMLTVSDMKGGTVRRSVLVTVGSPSTKTISGTITDGATPLAGVLVKEGSNYCYSSSDGTYTLTNVGTGSRTLSATLAGYSFTPSFANPVTVSANVTGADWTAAGTTFVTLTKTADATEGGASGNFRFTRTGDTSAALAVTVASLGGTATKTTDYTLSPDVSSNTFTIPAGSTTLNIAVSAVNDTAQEGPETITLQVRSGDGYWSSSANSVVMTLNDNDTALPQVAVSPPDPYAMEPVDHGSFNFTRTGSTSASLNLSVAWTGAATNGADYQTLSSTVTIPAGQASVTVPVTVLDDTAVETPEDLIVTVNTNAAYVRDPSATSASVTISDDDTPYVTVSVPDATSIEGGDAGLLLIHRTGSTAAALKVYYGLSGSAAHGTDYAPLTGEVVIPAGASSAPVVISAYDDEVGEGTETMTLTVASYNNSYSVGTVCQGTISVLDDADPPVISVRNGTIGTEGGSNSTVVFRSVGSASGNVTVHYTVSGAAIPGVDYTTLSGTVTVPASGPSDVTVTIPIINDAIAEATETVIVTITPDSAYRVFNDGSATALIRDNDSGSERVSVSSYHNDSAEDGADGTFYFYRTGITGNLTVNYGLSGTATNGSDYATLPGSVVIPDGESGVNVTFSPVNDSLAEGTETVVATVLPGSGYSADFPASDSIQITDNDTSAITVGFESLTSITAELPGANGQFRDFNVILSAAASQTVSVNVVGGAGTTSFGDDIDWAFVDPASGNAIVPYVTLVFPPGSTSQLLRVRVKNDGFAEPTETAIFELDSPHRASLTPNKYRHTMWISDSVIPAFATEERWNGTSVYSNQSWSGSQPYYTGMLPGFTTLQNVGGNYSRRIIGHITPPATGTYKFWVASDDSSRLYLSTNSSASNKIQIASLSGWTGFQDWDSQPSQASGNITLTAGQSYYMEVHHQEGSGDDHVSVAWEGPGFSRIPISFEVPDQSPRFVRFAVASSTVRESDGTDPMLMVLLDRPAGSNPITVDYSVGGTATPGSDFTLAPGTLTFTQGEHVKPLPLSLMADAVGEAPEAIVVSLTSPSGASLASPSSQVITVTDDASPTVTTLLVAANSSMGSGTVLGTATATAPPGRAITAWQIVAGNPGGIFSITSSGQVVLDAPGSLPNPGGMQLVVRATDNAGATGDGLVNVICNAAANGVVEERWNGNSAFDDDDWGDLPAYTGTLATFTSPQNVGSDYSRRLTGYIKPQTAGEYTFWIAGDDDCRLYLSSDSSSSNKVQIAAVNGWTNFQSWDTSPDQKSTAIPLVAGEIYRIEVHHREGSGGDHVSVAWQGPGISRQPIPASVIFPNVAGVTFDQPPPVPPTVALTSPADGTTFIPGVDIPLNAIVAGGSMAMTAVEFYQGSTLIGSDGSAPYSIVWTDATSGNHVLTAKAVYSDGSVTSSPVNVAVSAIAASGLLAERYDGINGATVANLTSAPAFPGSPSATFQIDSFEIPQNQGSNYGIRVGGWLRAPSTGDYTFWIASDDAGQLSLGSSHDPASASVIASVSGWTNYQQWDKYSTQQSATITLQAGSYYYIEALMKEASGNDHLSVAWSGPGFSRTVIPSDNLVPVFLPAPWTHRDIGSVGVTGDASHDDGTFTVTGSGTDIWGNADGFHFAYQPLAGDGEIVARVVSADNTNTWAKAGVMIRESLDANSKHAMMVVTPKNGVSFQRRSSTGGSSSDTTVVGISAPHWVRLVRSDNTFTAYRSADGASWTQVGSAPVSMASSLYVGLVVTSHNNGTSCEAVFDNVSVTSSSPLLGSYATFEAGNGISGAGAGADSDGDGIANGIEFVIGSGPADAASGVGLLPSATLGDEHLSITFRRTDASSGYGPHVEYGSDLVGWTVASHGVNGVEILETDDGFGAGVDQVVVRIPRVLANGSNLFVRLRVDIP